MPYGSGNLIKSEHINEFVHNTNLILGSGGEDFNGNPDDSYGYHLPTTSFSVSPGDVIDSDEWTYFYDTLRDIGQHQGTNIPPRDASTGTVIEGFTDLENDLNSIADNRFNVSSVFDDNITTTTTTSDWVTNLEHSITSVAISQGNFENTTKFFNRGGSISISVSSSIISFDEAVISPEIYHNTLLANSGEQLIITETSGNYEARVYAEANSAGDVDARLIIEDTRTNPPAKSTNVTSTFTENQPDTNLVSGSPINWAEALTFADATSPVSVNVDDDTASCDYDIAVSNDCTAHAAVTADVSGGSGSYSYSWTKLSGDGQVTSGSTSQTATISHTGSEGTYSGTFRVTVTDNETGHQDSDDLTVTFTHTSTEEINISGINLSANNTYPSGTNPSEGSSAEANLRLTIDGLRQHVTTLGGFGGSPSQTTTIDNEWVTSSPDTVSGIGDDYEVRAEFVSGDSLNTGTLDTWLPLSSDRNWTQQADAAPEEYEERSTTIFVRIRQKGDTSDLDNAEITISAQAGALS